ncbi:MAG: purine-cytosine permease family protein [Fusobacteriaceae bacterium]
MEKIIEKYDKKEFEMPVSEKGTYGWSTFAGSFAGEAVAGTEFVIGAMFVSWGVSAESVIYGLLIGNFLAMLNWYFLVGPIAVKTRLTLYGYLKKIAGPNITTFYNILNASLFCVLSGLMITVSASAVRIIFNIAPQVDWYPRSVGFIFIVLAIGIVVAFIAISGFKGIATFSSVCSPWILAMFVAGSINVMPVILNSIDTIKISSFSNFMEIANKAIWIKTPNGVGFWTVVAFAWICNLAFNAGLSDMAVYRYGKNKHVGSAVVFGLYLGHYVAWIGAGILGAGAALILKTNINLLDPGAVAYNSLGILGLLAVILAGWTTSNPCLYRSGLAFQSVFKNHSVKKVTLTTGILTSIIACFPFVFSQLGNFVGYMGVLLAPVGAIVITEHYIFPRIRYTQYWACYKNLSINSAAIKTWIISVIFAILLDFFNIIPLFFLFLPVYIFTIVVYIFLASKAGAKDNYITDVMEDKKYTAYITKKVDDEHEDVEILKKTRLAKICFCIASSMLIILIILSLNVYNSHFENYNVALNKFKTLAFIPTLIYFFAAIFYVKTKKQ